MNKAVISGRLTRDPEMRSMQDGTAIAAFTVAVDRAGKDAPTDFLPCKAFGKTAETAERWIGKGCRVIVEGRVQRDEWVRQDGLRDHATRIYVDRLDIIDFKGDRQQAQAAPQEQTLPPIDDFVNVDPLTDEGLPFA